MEKEKSNVSSKDMYGKGIHGTYRNMRIAILHSEHWVYVIVGIYVIVIELRFDNRILL